MANFASREILHFEKKEINFLNNFKKKRSFEYQGVCSEGFCFWPALAR